MKTALELVADIWPDSNLGQPDAADLAIIEAVAQRAREEMKAAAVQRATLTACIHTHGRPPCQHERCATMAIVAYGIRALPVKP